MLSLPLIPPRADPSLWPSHHLFPSFPDVEPSQSPPNTHTNTPRHPHPSHHARATTAFLYSLTHDENTIEQRKQNVRRFGSGWLRPPGVAKTLQALKDEELEREEQEMMARREQVLLDLAAAQQEVANEEQRREGEEAEEDGEEGGERDLDDSVPEAEDMSDSDDDDDDDNDGTASASATESDEHVDEEDTVPFNASSFLEGSLPSASEAEVSHMLEMEEAEIAGVLQDERDLDDDIPEAGEYEHTDSELEDTDSEIDLTGHGHSFAESRRSRRSSALSSRRTSGAYTLSTAQASTRRTTTTTTRRRRRSSHLHLPSAQRTSGLHRNHRRSSGLPGQDVIGYSAAGPAMLDLSASLGHGRSSFGLDGSSVLDGSSFLRSSPAANAARVSLRERFLEEARGVGRRE